MSNDDGHSTPPAHRVKRERSTRYPGVTLAESLKLCESIQDLGVDGLSAGDIASALGYKNIKTNTFSARLSAARQFALLNLTGAGYGLTPLCREILHPVEPAELPRLYRQALLKPPLYAELAERLAGKKVPDASILGNVLYHNHQIIATAKQAAAEAFLDSSRFAGALGPDGWFNPGGLPRADAVDTPAHHPSRPQGPTPETAVDDGTDASKGVTNSGRGKSSPSGREPTEGSSPTPAAATRVRSNDVRIDLRLWDEDAGKTIRVRAPESISPASLDRFLQALRLLVRVGPPAEPAARPEAQTGVPAHQDADAEESPNNDPA